MASVKSVTTYSERPWRNGKVKRRYEITLTDNNAVDHTYILMPVKVDPGHTGDVIAGKYLDGIIEAEVSKYTEMVRLDDDVNQFLSGDWNTQKELFKAIGLEAFKADKRDLLVVNFVQYVDQATDAQLRNLFDKTQTWVDNLRVKATQIGTMKAGLDAYTPEDLS